MKHFPSDTMSCRLTFVSNAFNTSVKFATPGNKMKSVTTFGLNSEWNLESESLYYSTSKAYSFRRQEMGFFSGFEAKLEFKRRSDYYLVLFVTPIFCLQVMIAFIPLLPVNSGERLGLACSLSLSFVMFLLLLEGMMPKTFDAMIMIGILFGFLLAVLNVIQSTIASWQTNRKESKNKVSGINDESFRVSIQKRRGDFTFFFFNIIYVLALNTYILVSIIGCLTKCEESA